MTVNRFSEAIVNLHQVKKLKKEQAALSYFRALSFAYYKVGKPEEAKKFAESALKYSTDPGDVEQASKLLQYGAQVGAQPLEPENGRAAAIKTSRHARGRRPGRSNVPAGKDTTLWA